MELDELPEIDPRADEVADDRVLADDDVRGAAAHGAAVADHGVRAAAREQRERCRVRRVGADEVEDEIRAAAAGQFPHGLRRISGIDDAIGAELPCERAPALVGVDRNDPARSELAHELERDVADTADADDRCG